MMNGTKEEGGVVLAESNKTKRPNMYGVFIHNDDYTPFDFVISVLMRLFGKSESTAREITSQIHLRGIALAGMYSHEVAESKAAKVHSVSKKEGYPLRSSIDIIEGDQEY